MALIVFTGECWISVADEPPPLDAGRFGQGWNHIGKISSDEAEFWQEVQYRRRPSAGFYISIFQEDLTELPPRFWLGVEWITDKLFVSTTPATPHTLARRTPETHPGLQSPSRYLSAQVTAERGQALLEPVAPR